MALPINRPGFTQIEEPSRQNFASNFSETDSVVQNAVVQPLEAVRVNEKITTEGKLEQPKYTSHFTRSCLTADVVQNPERLHHFLEELKPGSVCFFFDTTRLSGGRKLTALGQGLLGKGDENICHVAIFDSYNPETGEIFMVEAVPKNKSERSGLARTALNISQLNYTHLEFFTDSDDALRIGFLENARFQADGVDLYSKKGYLRSAVGSISFGRKARSRVIQATSDFIFGRKISEVGGNKRLKMICSSFVALAYQASTLLHLLTNGTIRVIRSGINAKDVMEISFQEQETEVSKAFNESPVLNLDAQRIMPSTLYTRYLAQSID